MDSIKDVLKKFNPLKDKYVSREFQMYGVYLSEKLQDEKHVGMYIKLAKEVSRPVLDEALRFVSDSNARNRVGLFMWKLKEMGGFVGRVKVKGSRKLRQGTAKAKAKTEKIVKVKKVKIPKVRQEELF
ncbi:MAG: hypothetical protein ACMG6E_03305 [Candidatus Roizmanbacteria bacterium]